MTKEEKEKMLELEKTLMNKETLMTVPREQLVMLVLRYHDAFKSLSEKIEEVFGEVEEEEND